jgi:hypothetical protein
METSMEILPLTCALGAELKGVKLADAARDDALFADIKPNFEHRIRRRASIGVVFGFIQ